MSVIHIQTTKLKQVDHFLECAYRFYAFIKACVLTCLLLAVDDLEIRVLGS